jgi:hypothetical protein
MRVTWVILGIVCLILVGAYATQDTTDTSTFTTVEEVTVEEKAHVEALLAEATTAIEQAEQAKAVFEADKSEANLKNYGAAVELAQDKVTAAQTYAREAGVQLDGMAIAITQEAAKAQTKEPVAEH